MATQAPITTTLQIDIWSDVVCPFCYIGDRHLELALEKFGGRDNVEIRYHSFLLMPELTEKDQLNVNSMLAEKRGVPREQAAAMNAQVSERAAAVGLEYHLDTAIATGTRHAHRLSHFAATQGKQHEMIQRLFKAYFTESQVVSNVDTLADLAAEVGLDREAARYALTSNAFTDEVNSDLAQAQQIGINGVPFFVFQGKYAVSGAQPVEAFEQVLNTVWTEITTEQNAAS